MLATTGLLSLLLWLLVLIVIVWLIFYVLNKMPIPADIRMPIMLIVGIILLVILLRELGVL